MLKLVNLAAATKSICSPSYLLHRIYYLLINYVYVDIVNFVSFSSM